MTLGRGVTQTSAHDWVLQYGATVGVIGILSVGAAIVSFGWVLFVGGFRRSPEIAGPLALAFAAYWAHALVSVGSIGVDWVPWLAFGGASALIGTRTGEPQRPRVIPRLAVAGIVGISVLGAASGISAWQASRDAFVARAAWTSGLGPAARGAGQAAVNRDAGRADYWNWLGLGAELQRDWKPAAVAFGQAAQRAPYEATYWSNLARARTQLAVVADQSEGGADAAIAAAVQGVRADPNAPETHALLAEVSRAFGRYDDALDAIMTAIRLYPLDANYDSIAIEVAPRVAAIARARADLAELAARRDSAPLRGAMAQLALRVGDRRSAADEAGRALALDPTNGEAKRIAVEAGGG
jgi:tetratricopeptide (TPR) repeat protein